MSYQLYFDSIKWFGKERIMGISSINSLYSSLSSGYSINKASDNAAGLAIAQKLKAQSNGYEVGANNAASMNDLINVADGGLGSITDSLQRMRELSVQASNTAIYSSDDISAMQDEINGLKQSIQDAAKGTQFNTMSLLDGSTADLNAATNPDGTGMSIQMVNSTLESLGIADYDVTGSFDISVIDKALETVSGARSSLGASSNALSSVINYNTNASLNLTSAQSRIEDLDYPKAVSELEKEKLLEQYRLNMAKKKTEEDSLVLKLF